MANDRQASGSPSTVNTASPSSAPRKIRKSVLALRGGRCCRAAARTNAARRRLGANHLGPALLQDAQHGRHVLLPTRRHGRYRRLVHAALDHVDRQVVRWRRSTSRAVSASWLPAMRRRRFATAECRKTPASWEGRWRLAAGAACALQRLQHLLDHAQQFVGLARFGARDDLDRSQRRNGHHRWPKPRARRDTGRRTCGSRFWRARISWRCFRPSRPRQFLGSCHFRSKKAGGQNVGRPLSSLSTHPPPCGGGRSSLTRRGTIAHAVPDRVR